MKILSDFSFNELIEELAEFPKFRAKQVFDAIIQAKDFEQTYLPKDMIEKLKQNYILKPVEIFKYLTSKDGTKKYLLQLTDGNIVECVFLHQSYGNTICLSSQVGCRMGCKFCASTLNGRVRDLTSGEMLSTIAVVNADNGKNTERNFTNIVIMGSGEPFDNYNNVVKWLKLITDEKGFNLSERNISLSTCGLVDKINQFAKEGFNVTLCVSLHATTDETRKTIMPIANRYSISEIIEALKNYVKVNSRRVVFEYCLIKDVNNTKEDIVLEIEHTVAAETVAYGKDDHEHLGEVREMFFEIKRRGKGAERKLDDYEQVAQVDDMGLFKEHHQQREGACDKEEEHSPEVHSAGVAQVEEDALLAREDILEIGQKRYDLLIHIAPGRRVASEGIEPSLIKNCQYQAHHYQRRSDKTVVSF